MKSQKVSPKLIQDLTRAFKLLNKVEKLKLLFYSIAQSVLSILDSLAILMIGAVVSLFIRFLSGQPAGDRVSTVMTFIGIQTLSFRNQIILFGIFASLLLVIKSLASLVLLRKNYAFLADTGTRIGNRLLTDFGKMDLTFIESKSIQGIVYTATSGSQRVLTSFLAPTIDTFSDVILILSIVISLFVLDTTSALIILFGFGIGTYTLNKVNKEKLRKLGKLQTDLTITSSEKITELMQLYRELKLRGGVQLHVSEIALVRNMISTAQSKAKTIGLISKFIFEILFVLLISVLILLAIFRDASYQSAGSMAVIFASITRLTPAFVRINQNFSTLRTSQGAIENFFSLYEDIKNLTKKSFENRLETSAKNNTLRDSSFHIEVRNLCFSFQGTHGFSLNNLDFEISGGEFVAIFGASGSGKSTLIDLLLGLRVPNSGYVTYGGLSPSDFLRRNPGSIAYVPQNVALVNGSVRENLTIGLKDQAEFSDDYLIECLARAGFGENLRQGNISLEEIIGESGRKLSGGERQRLGIARSLITKPKILFLDEATSALDQEKEFEVSTHISQLTGITRIVVTHRPTTIVGADKIVFIRDGTLIRIGNFDELRKQSLEFDSVIDSLQFRNLHE